MILHRVKKGLTGRQVQSRDYERLIGADSDSKPIAKVKWTWSSFAYGCVVGFITRGHAIPTQQRWRELEKS